MQTVSIQTAQNVEIEYEVASVGDRIVAYLIDMLIIVAYFIALTVLNSLLQATGLNSGAFFLGILYLGPVMFYDLICEIALDGQSIGKKARNIKVVKLDGTQPSIGSYLLRWLFRIIDITLTSGGAALLTLLINGKGQRLGDLAAGTTVVNLTERARLEDTIFTRVDENYSPVFPQAADLDDQIVSTIKEVLSVSIEEDRHSILSHSLARKTMKAIENKLGIKSELSPRPFLETILKDYNYLKGKL